MDPQTYLFTGYKPDFLRRADKLARSLAQPADVWRLGPNLRLSDIEAVRNFARIAPAEEGSSKRVAILNLEGSRGAVMTALLKFAEEPPPAFVLILLHPTVQAIPQTLVSRCIHERISVPKYGQLLVDLSRQGMETQSAAKLAAHLQRGYAGAEQVPSDTSIATAEALISAGRSGDVEQGMRLAGQFDELCVAALRERLASEKLHPLISASYNAADPKGVALIVFAALRR